jgi:hypothetical protein
MNSYLIALWAEVCDLAQFPVVWLVLFAEFFVRQGDRSAGMVPRLFSLSLVIYATYCMYYVVYTGNIEYWEYCGVACVGWLVTGIVLVAFQRVRKRENVVWSAGVRLVAYPFLLVCAIFIGVGIAVSTLPQPKSSSVLHRHSGWTMGYSDNVYRSGFAEPYSVDG